MTNSHGVTPDSPPTVETVTPEVQEEVAEETSSQSSKPPKGFVPYKALEEERTKTELLEQEIADLKSSLTPEEEDPKVSALSKRLNALEDDRELEKVIAENPKLKGLENELKEFRSEEHPRTKWSGVAKIFLVEKGLLEVPRQGLETNTGGGVASVKTGWTAEQIAELRVSNYREYVKKLTAGEFK